MEGMEEKRVGGRKRERESRRTAGRHGGKQIDEKGRKVREEASACERKRERERERKGERKREQERC